MNSTHDMGGMHGFGSVPHIGQDPHNHQPFDNQWESRVWGMVQGCTQAKWVNLDANRHSLEYMPPDLYLNYSYFERWLYGLTTRLLDSKLITLDEVKQGKSSDNSIPRSDARGPETVDPYQYAEFRQAVPATPKFESGDSVRSHNIHPSGHTRLPRYARDKCGHIVHHHGAHVLPDSNAHGMGENPTHLYTVAFTARALWGPQASAIDTVFVDIWECHLDLS